MEGESPTLTYLFITILFYYNFSCFSFDLYFFITEVITQIFIPKAKLLMSTEIETNESNAENETQPVTVQARISKCST